MIIAKDNLKNMYELKTDTIKNIVHEKNIGSWTVEDYRRYMKAYEKELISDINKMDKWCKLIDLTEYKVSSIVEEMKIHLEWTKKNGCTHCAVIVDNIITQMQMKRGGKGLVESDYFLTKKEAEDWLRSKGY